MSLDNYNSLELSTQNRENFNSYFEDALKDFDIRLSQPQHEEFAKEESKEALIDTEIDDKQVSIPSKTFL